MTTAKQVVRLHVDYDEEDGMIQPPFSAVTEEGHEDLTLEIGKSAYLKWYDEETETRVKIKITIAGIETP